jgi:hypothetical protein
MIYKNIPELHYKINTIEGFPMKKIDDYGITPCDVIFANVDKPADYLFCRSINVYDDRWRVNLYSKRIVYDIESRYISKSYFASFDKSTGTLRILS